MSPVDWFVHSSIEQTRNSCCLAFHRVHVYDVIGWIWWTVSSIYDLSISHSFASLSLVPSLSIHIYIYKSLFVFTVYFRKEKNCSVVPNHPYMCVCVCVFKKNSSNSMFSFFRFSFGFPCVFRVSDEMTEWLVDLFLYVLLLSGYFAFFCCFVYLCIYSEVERTVVVEQRQHTHQRHFVDVFFNSC